MFAFDVFQNHIQVNCQLNNLYTCLEKTQKITNNDTLLNLQEPKHSHYVNAKLLKSVQKVLPLITPFLSHITMCIAEQLTVLTEQ